VTGTQIRSNDHVLFAFKYKVTSNWKLGKFMIPSVESDWVRVQPVLRETPFRRKQQFSFVSQMRASSKMRLRNQCSQLCRACYKENLCRYGIKKNRLIAKLMFGTRLFCHLLTFLSVHEACHLERERQEDSK
jgi:hypothetical protein